jgi:F-type H+-transporting ATPase subunit epsilon
MTLALHIVTPQGEAYAGPVETVVLPGSEGDFGVLEGHERFLAPLRVGPLQLRDGTGVHWAAISEGFADVSGEQVVVLVGSCDRGEWIDRAEAERERDAARAALADLSGSEADQVRRPALEAALLRAETRVEVATRS